MKGNALGLFISGLIHVGIFFLIVYGLAVKPIPKKAEVAVPVQLAMFQEAVIKPVVPPPTPIIKKEEPKKPRQEAKPKTIKKPIVKKTVVKKKSTRKKPVKKKVVKLKAKKKEPKKPAKKKKSKQVAVTHMAAKNPVIKPAPIKPATPKKAKPPQRQKQQQTRPAQRPTPQRSRPQQRATPVRANNKAAEQRYKSQLHRLISKQKRYPARAKRKHEEGTVTISFIIYRNGRIQNIRVVRSSGSQTLDQAAINAVKQSSNRLPIPATIQRNQWQFTLPLVYRLR